MPQVLNGLTPCDPSPDQIRPAAEALNRIALDCGMQVASAHSIADKRTPVDTEGNVLARDVFGWTSEKAWWRNPRIALDHRSPQRAVSRANLSG
jgi:hypothetical protein